MSDFYYTPNPDVIHDEKEWDFTIEGQTLHFISDNGVFSKRTVDYGSRVLIENVNLTDLPAGPILDLGCGYGPIGLFLAKEYPDRQFELVDVNQRALALAERNAAVNGISNVTVATSDVYAGVGEQQFAAVVTNPPVRAGKDVVDAMITGAATHLRPNGRLLVVLQKKQGAPSAKRLMQATFGNAEVIKRDKGYYVLASVQHS
ncbi:class I SAM-dependent methyltransferase [Fructilactobacillus carniphilus]|uniref:Class I SAM-dependent methyltransferase n=1 Tax=Fructilactobacillus carniphilus TaxID=2940297 RepID=A0ABY5BUB2_9LACO|nr:class I SAM-dependent methyltransferase [Fructilactobacillus carniphilus]USS90096.1 class I SAM-dependent methyltransferase [Fructilactobacillus carniphilus]